MLKLHNAAVYWLLSFALGTERVHVGVVAVLPGHNYHGCSSDGSGLIPAKASSLLGCTAQVPQEVQVLVLWPVEPEHYSEMHQTGGVS